MNQTIDLGESNPSATEQILFYLTAIVQIRANSQFRAPDLIYKGGEDLVKRHGKQFTAQPLPEEYGLMEAKNCYNNAFILAAANPELTYVEGYAYSGILPIHHAWVVDAEGRVIDPTWIDPVNCTYFGVGFKTAHLRKLVNKRGFNPTMFDDYDRSWPLFRGRIPLSAVVDPRHAVNLDLAGVVS